MDCKVSKYPLKKIRLPEVVLIDSHPVATDLYTGFSKLPLKRTCEACLLKDEKRSLFDLIYCNFYKLQPKVFRDLNPPLFKSLGLLVKGRRSSILVIQT
jgi:hypothetical protein